MQVYVLYSVFADGVRTAMTAYTTQEAALKHIEAISDTTKRFLDIKRFQIEQISVKEETTNV